MQAGKLRKAVFPVAGIGTRLLPVTKTCPKEMLPIINRPLIQYAVDEAVAAGITQLIFVVSRTKHAICEYFDAANELEQALEQRQNTENLSLLHSILPTDTSCVFVYQKKPLGLGHAVLCARDVVDNEPFAVLLADDLIIGDSGAFVLQQMCDIWQGRGDNLIATQTVPADQVNQYGIVATDADASGPGPHPIRGICEKPTLDQAPSRMAVVGRYILSPGIFNELEKLRPEPGTELQLTDALAGLLERETVRAFPFKGKRHDCGSKYGYVQAILECALLDPEISPQLRNRLHQLTDNTKV